MILILKLFPLEQFLRHCISWGSQQETDVTLQWRHLRGEFIKERFINVWANVEKLKGLG